MTVEIGNITAKADDVQYALRGDVVQRKGGTDDGKDIPIRRGDPDGAIKQLIEVFDGLPPERRGFS